MSTTFSSVTRQGAYEPFDLQVARGQIAGHSTLNIYGFQLAVTTTFIPVWSAGGAYAYPVSAVRMNLASTVNTGGDLTATVFIQGLDANYNISSETLQLNGTTPVPTVNSYLRINGTAVNSGTPTGTITLKNLANTVTYSQITAGYGRSQDAVYTVPAGYTFYLSRVDAYSSANGNTADYLFYRNLQTSSTGVTIISQQAPFIGSYAAQRVMPRGLLEKTDIQLQAKSTANTYAVNISAEGYLIKNDGQA